jgi:hypothetical protein
MKTPLRYIFTGEEQRYSTKRFAVTHLTIYDYATNILWIMVDFVLNFLVNISYSIPNNK